MEKMNTKLDKLIPNTILIPLWDAFSLFGLTI